MEETKGWWASKTIWLNGLAFIAAVSGAFGVDLGLTAAVQAEIVIGIMAVVNVGLRAVTTKKLV